MARYRVINPGGDVAPTKEIDSADNAHAWFVDQAAINHTLGWRMEVQEGDQWRFFDNSDGTPSDTSG